ncbi:translation initiation factor IF-2-like [Moschus berezovskii]|uniref:translation initiation factor IF-2-like n=1 Tax=Moschus berezovskii TaxID=68408 RepID=UPI002443D029|nr:translation initiation factor IF-2-like [Moschus berezovskii]
MEEQRGGRWGADDVTNPGGPGRALPWSPASRLSLSPPLAPASLPRVDPAHRCPVQEPERTEPVSARAAGLAGGEPQGEGPGASSGAQGGAGPRPARSRPLGAPAADGRLPELRRGRGPPSTLGRRLSPSAGQRGPRGPMSRPGGSGRDGGDLEREPGGPGTFR